MLIRATWPLMSVFLFIALVDLPLDSVGGSFAFSVVLSCIGLSLSMRRSANFLTFYFVFSIIFLGLVPWLHYARGVTLWLGRPLEQVTYIDVNILLAVANFAVIVTYLLSYRRGAAATEHVPRVSSAVILGLAALSSFGTFLFLFLNEFNVNQILFRGLIEEERTSGLENQAASAILFSFARLVPVFCLFFALSELKGRFFLKAFLFVAVLIVAFPTGAARFIAASIYIPLLMIMFPFFRRAWVISLFLIASLTTIFPFLNQFRYFSGFEEITLVPDVSFFLVGHFDAFENFASAYEHGFISYGWQILGVVAFFVPRAFWASKPFGSGYQLSLEQSYLFNNISMTFLGEGYVNFGVPGVLVFAITLGFIMARLDSKFAALRPTGTFVGYDRTVYLFMMAAFFFFLRGDMLSGTSYLVSGFFSAWVVKLTIQFLGRLR